MPASKGRRKHDDSLHEHPRRRSRLTTLLALALVSGSLGAGALSLAIFTDLQAVTGNAFVTGLVDISTTPATALFSAPNMMPGDTSSQTIHVNNAGTGALHHAISTSVVSGPTLAAQLHLDVYAGATCTGTALYMGALDAAAVGSSAQGANAGDRALAGLTNETLCFKAILPLSTNSTFQNRRHGTATAATAPAVPVAAPAQAADDNREVAA